LKTSHSKLTYSAEGNPNAEECNPEKARAVDGLPGIGVTSRRFVLFRTERAVRIPLSARNGLA